MLISLTKVLFRGVLLTAVTLSPILGREPVEKNILHSIHFDIYYPQGFERMAVVAAAELEAVCEEAAGYAGLQISRPVRVVFGTQLAPGTDWMRSGTHKLEFALMSPGNRFTVAAREALLSQVLMEAESFGTGFSGFLPHIGEADGLMTRGAQMYFSGDYDAHGAAFAAEAFKETKAGDMITALLRGDNINSHQDVSLAASFFYFWDKEYPLLSISRLFHAAASGHGFLAAAEMLTGSSSAELSKRWSAFMEKEYCSPEKADLTGNSMIVPGAAPGELPVLSPDKNKAAICRMRSVLLFDSFGVQAVGLSVPISCIFEKRSRPSWSSDGRLFALSAQSEGRACLAVIDSVKAEVSRVIKLPLLSVSSVSFAPDGKSIAFAGHGPGKVNIFTCDIDGGSVRMLTSGNYACTSPVFTPDGDIIYISQKDRGSPEVLMRLRMKTGQSEELFIVSGANELAVSPDGTLLAVSISGADGDGLMLINPDSGYFASVRLPALCVKTLTGLFDEEFAVAYVEGRHWSIRLVSTPELNMKYVSPMVNDAADKASDLQIYFE